MELPMNSRSKFISGITTLDKTAFSVSTGLRSAIFVMLPLIIGLAVGFSGAIFFALGALFLSNTEGPHSTLPLKLLLVACFTEALAWAMGTLAGTAGIYAVPLVGMGVFIASLGRIDLRWTQVAIFTAICFAVGAGLPGDTVSAALQRSSLALLGSLFALSGVWLHRFFISRKTSQTPSPANAARPRREVFRITAALGIASALGFGIALWLGLPRDFWVVVTILFTFRPVLSLTVSFTAMMVLGTLLGSAIGGAVVLEITNLYVLLILLSIFSFLMFATRGVNLGVVQIFFGAFIIILLNIVFPARLLFAEARIVDVVLGGMISITIVYIIGLKNVVRKT